MIEFSGVGQLRSPVVVAAFEGWNDAADASSAAVEHLETVFGARVIGAIDPDDYYDFQVNRPTVSGVEGAAARKISWPTTRLSVARPPKSDSDLVLIRGLEPNMRWRGFTDELIEAVHALGSDMVVTLGALLADSPHTRPVPISGTAGDPVTAARLGLEASRYEGPTGIVGVFSDACARAELSSVSFWAAVPHYVANPPCPKATLALLRRVEDLLDLEIPLAALPERARAWERQVDELAAGDSEVAEYVRSLESREPETALPEASGDAIAREFERYLRRRGQ
ncbi:PAC2 family protein [Frankia sp. CNm7]|uniref:PAC2 family protein n=1 Tax=Frankia nepalensis TaxID=1836974 RepID=UPI001933C63D|nr:PAC2 family protein [Frankia nepalensis]MBL7521868.1 PAC2 family protein [Frankia nepalensis]